MSNLSPRVLLIIALVISFITAGLLYGYLNRATETAAPQRQVVTAAVDLPGGTLLKPEMLKLVAVPETLVQAEAVTAITEAVGQITKAPMAAGDQVTLKRLAADGKVPGFVGSIPKDKRAITIGVSDVTGMGGFLKAGDYVDVMNVVGKDGSRSIAGRMLLQNILILAVNKVEMTAEKEAKPAAMATLTLAVSPEEALRVAVAQQRGALYVTMRPFQPTERFVVSSYVDIDPSRDPAPAQPNAHPVSAPPVRTAEQQAPAPAINVIPVIRGTSIGK